MSWRTLLGKVRRGKPLAYVETRSEPMSYSDRSARDAGRRAAEEDLQATAAAIVWGVAIGAGVALIVWTCMQPLPG